MSTLSKITGIARNSSEEPEPGTDLQRNAAQVEAKNALFATPAHYNKPVMPWDLIEHMESSGNALVDFLATQEIDERVAAALHVLDQVPRHYRLVVVRWRGKK